MFTDEQFKLLLVNILEREKFPENSEEMNTLISKIKISELLLEETSDYTYYKGYKEDWNTLCTYLKIKVPLSDIDFFQTHKNIITRIAKTVYDKQGDNVLVDTKIIPLPDSFEVINFDQIKTNDIILQAIEEAEKSMREGEYHRAFDRVHTALHGYLIDILMKYEVEVSKDEKLASLYKKIQELIEKEIKPTEIGSLVKTTIRSSNGMINALNEVRNRHSLAHPNINLIGKNEAKLIIGITSAITDYISGYLY